MLGKPSKAGETLQRLGEPFKDRMKTSKAGGNASKAGRTLYVLGEPLKGWGNTTM